MCLHNLESWCGAPIRSVVYLKQMDIVHCVAKSARGCFDALTLQRRIYYSLYPDFEGSAHSGVAMCFVSRTFCIGTLYCFMSCIFVSAIAMCVVSGFGTECTFSWIGFFATHGDRPVWSHPRRIIVLSLFCLEPYGADVDGDAFFVQHMLWLIQTCFLSTDGIVSCCAHSIARTVLELCTGTHSLHSGSIIVLNYGFNNDIFPGQEYVY